MVEPTPVMVNQLAQTVATIELARELQLWHLTLVFMAGAWWGCQVVRIGDGFSVCWPGMVVSDG